MKCLNIFLSKTVGALVLCLIGITGLQRQFDFRLKNDNLQRSIANLKSTYRKLPPVFMDLRREV